MEIKLIIAGSRDFNNYELLEKEVDWYLEEILKEECGIDLVSDGQGNWFWARWALGEGVEPEDLPVEIISGGARGADRLGEAYAKSREYKVKKFIPDWEKGKSAGMKRNIEMLKYSTHAIIFWDGISKGSKQAIDNAKKYDVKLRVIGYVPELLKTNNKK